MNLSELFYKKLFQKNGDIPLIVKDGKKYIEFDEIKISKNDGVWVVYFYYKGNKYSYEYFHLDFDKGDTLSLKQFIGMFELYDD